jgi:4-hydroxy-3-methylbut-2-enyl diphosphate reductase
LVDSPRAAAAVDIPDPARVAWLSQTTLSVDETQETVRALRERFPAMVDPPSDDICYATQNRQEAVKAIAARADVVLVIGSANSSNSNRLVEVAGSAGAPAHLIDDERDIDPAWLGEVGTIGLTAGASAPEHLVERVIAYLREHGAETVEEVQVAEEHVVFSPPVQLRPSAVAARVAAGSASPATGWPTAASASSSITPSSGPVAMTRSPAWNSNRGLGR